jgi:hypothetical protein
MVHAEHAVQRSVQGAPSAPPREPPAHESVSRTERSCLFRVTAVQDPRSVVRKADAESLAALGMATAAQPEHRVIPSAVEGYCIRPISDAVAWPFASDCVNVHFCASS